MPVTGAARLLVKMTTVQGLLMQKFAVAIAAVPTLTGACAFAADMAVKAPPLPSLPIPNWTGFYIGGAFTWWTTSTSDLPGTIVDVSSPRNFDPSGLRAGGYASYNWQIAAWEVGLVLACWRPIANTPHSGARSIFEIGARSLLLSSRCYPGISRAPIQCHRASISCAAFPPRAYSVTTRPAAIAS